MKSNQQGIKVSILGREFFVGCDEEQRDKLIAAASFLDKQMRDIQRGGKVIGVDRCAIMAALNISHDLLETRQKIGTSADYRSRVVSIQRKIDSIMHEEKQLTI